MGESKPVLKLPIKNASVSVSTMLNKASIEAQRQGKAAQKKYAIEKSKSRAKKTKKRTHKTEHPLATAFSDSIEESRSHIVRHGNINVEAGSTALSHHLSNSHDHLHQLGQRGLQTKDIITRPIKTHAINWDSADGTQSGVTELGPIMKTLKRAAATEEKEIARLCDEWQEVDEQIGTATLELVGENEYERIMTGVIDASMCHGNDSDLRGEIEAEKKRAMKQIEEANLFAMNAMQESEQKLKIKQHEMQKSFYKLLNSEEY